MGFFNCHTHTMYSNLRLLDSIIKPKDLLDRAVEIGYSGLAITEHDCLSSHVKVNKYAREIQKTHPDFKVALGNEIYLCKDRSSGQKYHHFILIAKNTVGHKALRELSSRAWMNSYWDRGMERVVTTYDDLKEIVNKYPNSLIASNACFRQGTKVITKTGEKNIEDITNTDYILNLSGGWEKVNFPTSREYKGKGRKITFLENNIPTVCTENHQFLATTNNKIKAYRESNIDPRIWIEAKDLITKTGSSKHICLYPIPKINYSSRNIIYRKEWENCLLDKTYFRKVKINDKIQITPEVMRLFGLFLGDGSISINKEKKCYSIDFCFNIEEYSFYKESFVDKASKEIGITWSENIREDKNRVDICSHSIDLVELFYYIFSNVKAENKFIPNRLKHISLELDYELIFGYELADGYFRTHINKNKNIISGEMVSASISYQLSKDIQELLRDLNIRSSIYKRDGRIDKKGANHQDSWYITSSNNAWKEINKKSLFSHEDVVEIFKQAQIHCNKNFVTIEGIKYKKVYIKSVEKIDLQEKVYCLNVNSHSFVCNGVIVHNCLGGQLASSTLALCNAERIGDERGRIEAHNNIVKFILYCKELFGEDFYCEIAPGCSKEQIIVNKRLVSIAKAFNLKMVIGTDAHMLRKEDRYIHEAFLNAKGGERETASFYEYAYLQTKEEIIDHLSQSDMSIEQVNEMFENSMEIYNKIENYSLEHKQSIPKVEVKNYPKIQLWNNNKINNYPILRDMFNSDDAINRYWVNQCFERMVELFDDSGSFSDILDNHEDYVKRLEEEADTKKVIGQKLDTNMFSYPVTLQHYVDLFWECGSIVGAGRGSSCSGLNHFLMGLVQLNPMEWNFPWFRYMNKERTELGDIDLDLCPSKRPLILKKIKEERGQNFNKDIDDLSKKNLGCTLIATFGTLTAKNAVLVSARGYRSEDFPDGIDSDTAQYLASLIPIERGFVWSLHDTVYGNEEKGRKSVQTFIKEVNQYPRLLEIMFGIEGCIDKRSSHASGVILFDEDPYEKCCFMKTPKGEIITQYDLHDSEAVGLTKYDFLITEVCDKIVECIKLLQKNKIIDNKLSLKEVYNKFLHPNVLPFDDKEVWKNIQNGTILDQFQFSSQVGIQAAKKIKPKNIQELTDCNGLNKLAQTYLTVYQRGTFL